MSQAYEGENSFLTLDVILGLKNLVTPGIPFVY